MVISYDRKSTEKLKLANKTLVFRLSSLGDLILATSVLSSTSCQMVDWVVAIEYLPLLEGHPSIRRLWPFDRKNGLGAWIRLCHELWTEDYSEVVDLHSSLRTRIARICFTYFAFRSLRLPPKWRAISKSRWKLSGLFIFKKYWPKWLRPVPYRERFSLLVGGSGEEKPNFKWHLEKKGLDSWENFLKSQNDFISAELLLRGNYICVMPSAAWEGKRLPIQTYVHVLEKLNVERVILGGPKDQESLELVERLQRAQIPFISGVGKWSLSQVSMILGHSKGYLGNDTGLAHLAEAVGVPAFIVYGPTIPEMGFGPWNVKSRSIGANLWCRPCSKDGTACFRPINRYMCLSQVNASDVQVAVETVISVE